MKNFKFSIAYLAIFAMIFTSCSKDEPAAIDPDGSNSVVLTFGALLNDMGNATTKQAQFEDIPTCTDAAPSYAVIELTVDGMEKDPITVDILSDDDGLFTAYSEDLKIQVNSAAGVDISVTSFMVYADGIMEPIWVAPAGGDFAGYVDNPLPLNFNLQRGTKPYIDIEVLCFDRRLVNEYGYPFFDLVPTVVYPLCFFVNYCITPDGRHYVGNYSLDLWYDDGETKIPIYTDETPTTDMTTGGEYFARTVCVVVPGTPEGFGPDDDYLFYVITPLDWPGSYGDIDNTPLPEVGLSWNDIDGLLNADGLTNEYLHIFIGCDDGPQGDCPITPEDSDGDCVPDNDDICPGFDDRLDADGDNIPDGCDNCPEDANNDQLDTDGDEVGDVCDNCPNDANPNQEDSNMNGIGDACDYPSNGGGDDCETAFMVGDTEFWDIEAINNNRWGWAEHIMDGDLPFSADFYAGAGQNILSNGEKVGTVDVTMVGDEVSVVITMMAGVDLNEVHIYFSDTDEPDTNAPGQYGNTDDNPASGKEYTFTSTDGDFWLIVHAEVCQ